MQMRLQIRCVLTMVAKLKMVASSSFLNDLQFATMGYAGWCVVSLLPGMMCGCLGYKNGLLPAFIDDAPVATIKYILVPFLVISPQDKSSKLIIGRPNSSSIAQVRVVVCKLAKNNHIEFGIKNYYDPTISH